MKADEIRAIQQKALVNYEDETYIDAKKKIESEAKENPLCDCITVYDLSKYAQVMLESEGFDVEFLNVGFTQDTRERDYYEISW
jgi:hypothetical protein